MSINDGKCDTCNRPIVSPDDDWIPSGPECGYPGGSSCRAYFTKAAKNPNHDHHPLAQAFSKSLKEWLDAGATLSSVIQTLDDECYNRSVRINDGEKLFGSSEDWEAAAKGFFKFNEPEGLT
jgi:hypothetical protein